MGKYYNMCTTVIIERKGMTTAANERTKSGAVSQSGASVIGGDDRTQVCCL